MPPLKRRSGQSLVLGIAKTAVDTLLARVAGQEPSAFASEASGVGQNGKLCADVRNGRRIDVYDGQFRLSAEADQG
jgi:hypothetical protein